MGAASSLINALPDKLSPQEIEEICSVRYKDNFNHLKDENGFVPRDKFIAEMSTQQEQEVFSIFSAYSIDGQANIKQIQQICRDARLFKKNGFSASDAEEIFEKNKLKDSVSVEICCFHA